MKALSRWIFWIVGLASTALVICYAIFWVAGLMGAPWLEQCFRPRARTKFTAEGWHSSRFGEPVRYEMANDLLHSGKLKGMKTDEIATLLGPADRWARRDSQTNLLFDLCRQKDLPARSTIFPARFFWNIESWVLEIECDQGRAKSVKIRSG